MITSITIITLQMFRYYFFLNLYFRYSIYIFWFSVNFWFSYYSFWVTLLLRKTFFHCLLKQISKTHFSKKKKRNFRKNLNTNSFFKTSKNATSRFWNFSKKCVVGHNDVLDGELLLICPAWQEIVWY